jgi:hypothetical protein
MPWLALLLGSFLLLFLTIRASRARLELRRLRQLHADQFGTAQSLSFVLALPLFLMVMLFIVQVSQLMIGQIVVEYAAFAAARAATVWIPACLVDDDTGEVERWNCVRGYAPDGDAAHQQPSPFGPTDGGMTYKLTPTGGKYEKIRMAAALACLPISPSRPLPGVPNPPTKILGGLETVYAAMAAGSAPNVRIPDRLRNKLAYTLFQDPSDASKDTLIVDVRFYHSNREFPLIVPTNPVDGTLGIRPDLQEFRPGKEVGWQDPITVTVKYKLALLPGPGRLLARSVLSPTGAPDTLSSQIANRGGGLYVYPLSASATLGNEGEKPNHANYYPLTNL